MGVSENRAIPANSHFNGDNDHNPMDLRVQGTLFSDKPRGYCPGLSWFPTFLSLLITTIPHCGINKGRHLNSCFIPVELRMISYITDDVLQHRSTFPICDGPLFQIFWSYFRSHSSSSEVCLSLRLGSFRSFRRNCGNHTPNDG